MVRCFVKTLFFESILVLALIFQLCLCAENYDAQRNYNDRQPLDFRSNDRATSSSNHYDLYEQQKLYQATAGDTSYGTNEQNPEQNNSLHTQQPKGDQPHQEQYSPSSQDPNIILVPRLGLVRGQYKFKLIKNRQISAYFGLKYGFVKPGIGRFQVIS